MIYLELDDSLAFLMIQELQNVRAQMPANHPLPNLHQFERILGGQLPTARSRKRKRANTQAGGGGGNPGNGGNGGNAANHNWTPDCQRNATRQRLIDQHIGLSRIQLIQGSNGQILIRSAPVVIPSRNNIPQPSNLASNPISEGMSNGYNTQPNPDENELPSRPGSPVGNDPQDTVILDTLGSTQTRYINSLDSQDRQLRVNSNVSTDATNGRVNGEAARERVALPPRDSADAGHPRISRVEELAGRNNAVVMTPSPPSSIDAHKHPENDVENEGDDNDWNNDNDEHHTPRSSESANRPNSPNSQYTVGPAPLPTVNTATHLAELACILAPSSQQQLHEILKLLATDSSLESEQGKDLMNSKTGNNLPTTLHMHLKRCKRYDVSTCLDDLFFMLSAMEMALEVDALNPAPRMNEISRKSGYGLESIKYWYKVGKRALILCAASSPSILIIIAVLRLKTNLIANHKGGIQGIQELALEFRNPGPSQAGHGVRDLLIPYIHYLNRCLASIPALAVTFPDGHSVPFYEMQKLDQQFAKAKLEIFHLPLRSSVWADNLEELKYSGCPPTVPADVVQKAQIFTADWTLKDTPRPTSAKETKSWTEKQRKSASKAHRSATLAEFYDRWKTCKSEGRSRSTYLYLDPAQCEDKTIRFEDNKGKFLGLLITHLQSKLLGWNDDMNRKIQLLFPNEFHKDDSSRKFHKFLAYHFSWYNRYSEKGHSAPKDIHPNFIYKANSSKVNYFQRSPWLSKEAKENPVQYECLSKMLEEVVSFVEANLRDHLPKEYDELRVYCDRLPAGEQSPVYPFGGFVLNICACSTGHRDTGDKSLCVVIPFGDFSGGELCLYETKTVIGLRPGDIFIFPSSKITHFNLHFKGWRGSLVFHTDKQSDDWVKDFNGWQWKSTSEYIRVSDQKGVEGMEKDR